MKSVKVSACLKAPLYKSEPLGFVTHMERSKDRQLNEVYLEQDKRYEFFNYYVASGLLRELIGEQVEVINDLQVDGVKGEAFFEVKRNDREMLSYIFMRNAVSGKELAFLARALVGDADNITKNYLALPNCRLINFSKALQSFEQTPKKLIEGLCSSLYGNGVRSEEQDELRLSMRALQIAATNISGISADKIYQTMLKRAEELMAIGMEVDDIHFQVNGKDLMFKSAEGYAKHMANMVVGQRELIGALIPALSVPSVEHADTLVTLNFIKKTVVQNLEKNIEQQMAI
ncbi:MAG: hypothetical protein ACHP6I_03020 [Rickettsiales bacterium]